MTTKNNQKISVDFTSEGEYVHLILDSHLIFSAKDAHIWSSHEA